MVERQNKSKSGEENVTGNIDFFRDLAVLATPEHILDFFAVP
jgi:hypothetical protein